MVSSGDPPAAASRDGNHGRRTDVVLVESFDQNAVDPAADTTGHDIDPGPRAEGPP